MDTNDSSCIWFVPPGICGPTPSPDGKSLALCEKKKGCGYEARLLTVKKEKKK